MASQRLAGQRIHKHRVQLGLSPEQYGLRIGLAGMTVRRVELGFPVHLSTAKKFSDDLDLDVVELFPQPTPRRKVAA